MGKFIVIEGGDGAGKATQAQRLQIRLIEDGRYPSEVCTPMGLSFPRYATPIGRVIARHLRGEIMVSGTSLHIRAIEDALVFQCLMLADKIEAGHLILQHLASGCDVVADRWWPSAYAYGGSDGLSDEWLIAVHQLLPVPDRYVLLDLNPELAIERVVKRAAATGRQVDRYETVERQTRVRARYLDLVLADREQRWRVVDASRTEDEVAAAVLASVND